MSELIETSNNSLETDLNCCEQLDKKPNNGRSLTSAEWTLSYELCERLVDKLMQDQAVELIKHFENKKIEERFQSVVDCTFYAVISTYVAIINLYPEDIAKAVNITKECVAYCSQRRKKWSLTTAVAQVLRLKSNGEAYTDDEALAEVCYGGLMAMRGVLNFVRDNNVFTMIAGSVRLKVAHESFRLCRQIMNNRKWENSELKLFFMQVTNFGHGIYNVLLAMIPNRILRILEFMGFTGDKVYGLQMLVEGCDGSNSQSIGGLICFISLFFYVVKIKYLLGTGSTPEEIELVYKIAQRLSAKYPDNSAFTAYTIGRLENLKGNAEQGMFWLEKSLEKNTKRVFIQLFALWDLGSCYLAKSKPREAAQAIQRMRLNSNISNSSMAYIEAVFLLSANDLTEEDRKYANELLEMVPNVMAEYCGKHVPWEKFCARKARQYFAQDNFLMLPEYEIMYTFNTFYYLKTFLEN
ncbi:Tetratricopeptide repeat protein 39B [Chamberlinius hualienensis]